MTFFFNGTITFPYIQTKVAIYFLKSTFLLKKNSTFFMLSFFMKHSKPYNRSILANIINSCFSTQVRYRIMVNFVI